MVFLYFSDFCFNKVKTVEEQVNALAEHKLGVANQSITAGFYMEAMATIFY